MSQREYLSAVLLRDGWHDVVRGTFRLHGSGMPVFGEEMVYTWLDPDGSDETTKVRLYVRAVEIVGLQMTTETIIDDQPVEAA